MPHFHNAYSMIYIQNGKVRLCLGDEEMMAEGNSLVFISHLEKHAVTVLEEPYWRYSVEIAPEYADMLIMDSRLLSVFKNRPEGFRHVFNVSGIQDELNTIFAALLKASNIEDEFAETYVGCLLRELLITVYRNNKEQFPLIKGNVKSVIYDIQKYIDEHYREQITITDIANEFFISSSYLTHSFTELTGLSPKQYIMKNRLIYSKDLLTQTSLAISEVSYRSGFQDVNNYIKHFKKVFGWTPNSVRKKLEAKGGCGTRSGAPTC